MLFKATTIVSAAALFFAGQAMAAPSQDMATRNEDVATRSEDVAARDEMAILIATDPCGYSRELSCVSWMLTFDTDFACNCPNNCSHKKGSSCKYYKNFSDSGPVAKGSMS
jgi:hypothetical protein